MRKGITRNHMQPEASGFCSLPFGSKSVVDTYPCHLIRIKEGSRAEHIDKHIEGSGKGEHMGHAHPVERSISRALRRVDVVVSIHIQHSDWIFGDTTEGGDHSKRNSAVPTEYEQCVSTCQKWDEAFDQLADRFGHVTDVLRPRVESIRAPNLKGQVTLVMHLQA